MCLIIDFIFQILCLYTKQMVPYDVPVNFYLQRALTVPEESTLRQSIDILKVIIIVVVAYVLHIFISVIEILKKNLIFVLRALMRSIFVRITSN